MTILEEILREKEQEVSRLLAEPVAQTSQANAVRPSLFGSIKKAKQLQVIAEIKRASPSKGIIHETVNPVQQAEIYERAGAACVSVLTDTSFFNGSFEDLKAVAEAVRIPVLCKDFIIHPVQIDRAAAAGASVILLIVAALPDAELNALRVYATALGLEVLVEVHDADELNRALEAGAQLIGVNNRDLRTFQVDLARTEEVASVFPFHSGRVLISESGIGGIADAQRAAKAGAGAVLVGETLMRSESPEQTIRSLQVDLGGSGQ
ncbi:indole-3-glycerol phosphate synthase TrpC [Sporosarcina gallistercoris]|uniref:Indole-3-glycerol phosphate synthase n=1 Tax=Sporosarcina gallistercoris TaxID=2762245 RepID=A0ABR8PHF4_9BACL|nr:indole-3-glycerol phosphate synthase TrpC [Sporosarcina gallistercoris]MBD7907604.1 indole-3-glycerol phosphate synthase TrpC [Sporosarcina gallistercoris]